MINKTFSFGFFLCSLVFASSSLAQSTPPAVSGDSLAYSSPVHERMNNLREVWYDISESTGSVSEIIKAEEEAVLDIKVLPRSTWSAKDQFGHTPLFYAVWLGLPRVTKLLLTEPLVRAQVNEEDSGMTPLLVAGIMPRQTMLLCRTEGFIDDKNTWLPPMLLMPYYVNEDPYRVVTSLLKENGARQVSGQQVAALWSKRCPSAPPVPSLAAQGQDALALASISDFKRFERGQPALAARKLRKPKTPRDVQKNHEFNMDMASFLSLRTAAYDCIETHDQICASVKMIKSIPDASVRISITKKGSAAIVAVYSKTSEFFSGNKIQAVKRPGLQSDWICSHNVKDVDLKMCDFNPRL